MACITTASFRATATAAHVALQHETRGRITLQELSEKLGVHRQTAYGWLRRGKLKGRVAKVGTQRIWLVSLSQASSGIRTGESS